MPGKGILLSKYQETDYAFADETPGRLLTNSKGTPL